METEKVLLTKEGEEKLNKEYRELLDIIRPQVIEELKQAKGQGDLSENADYDAARTRQAEVEARIKEIEDILHNAEIIVDADKQRNVVRVGSTVTYLDLSDNQEYTYQIVGSVEADPFVGKISNESALGSALLGKTVSKKPVEVYASKETYKIEILKIK